MTTRQAVKGEIWRYIGNVLGTGSLFGLLFLTIVKPVKGYEDGELILFILMSSWAIGLGISMTATRMSGNSPWRVFGYYLSAGIVTFFITFSTFAQHMR